MIQALAPGLRRGCSWVCLVSALAAGSSAQAVAQDGKKSGSPSAKPAAKKGEAPKAEAAKKADAPKAEAQAEAPPAPKAPGVEVFKDERAEKALAVFKNVPGLRAAKPNEIALVKAMAGGAESPDRDLIQKFVEGMAYELIDKSNINGLIDPPDQLRRQPTSKAAHGLKDATDALLDALASARLAKNDAFLKVYNQALLATLPKLLDNNLVSRVEAMIVLGQTNSPDAVPIYLAQIKSPDQTLWVKVSALKGLTGVVEGGARTDAVLGSARAVEAAKVVADFLEAEKDLPWPVVVRALEAIGAMRQASVATALQKADLANTAMEYLADADSPAEVRASAAWAIGMVQVNSAVSKYNYPLVTYHIGRLTADLADKVAKTRTSNPYLAERWTGLLVGPVFQAFNGLEGVRETGLLHVPNAGPSQSGIKQMADLESAVAKAAVELVRATPGQLKDAFPALASRTSALKAYLDKNPPKDFHLVPGGPEYRPGDGQVATAPNEPAKVVGAPGGK